MAVLPYAFAVDHWRWNVFRGLILPLDYNKEWRNNRLDISLDVLLGLMNHWIRDGLDISSDMSKGLIYH